MKAALKQIPEKIQELIESHVSDLEEAWKNLGEANNLAISIPIKIGFDKTGKPFCEVGISFVVDKCVDSMTFNWNDRQLSLLKTKGGDV